MRPQQLRARPAARGLLSPTQRLLFVMALFTFGLASIYTSVALITRVTPALFPGKNFADIPIVGDISAKLPVAAPGVNSSFNKRINLLILGVDQRPYASDESLPDEVRFQGRTDTIMVATIDPVTKQLSFLGFPRDMLVDLSGPNVPSSPWKINEAYTYGVLQGNSVDSGAHQLEKDMKNDFGIDIDYYVVMNFTAVQKLVDAVGGVDVTIPDDLGVYGWFYSDEGNVPPHYVTYASGPFHFDGYNAVAFGRNRDPSDFTRVKRQQLILKGVLSKAFSQGLLDIGGFADLYSAYKKTITTDMPYSKMAGLAPLLKDTVGSSLTYSLGDPVDGQPTTWSGDYYGASVDYWNPDNVAYWIDQTFTKASYSQSTVEIDNGYGDDGSVRSASLGHYLKFGKGLPTVYYGADEPAQPETTITLYDSNKQQLADDIAKWLNVGQQNMLVKDKSADATLPDVIITIGRDYQVPKN
jgi:polyisoprenyl-teichoic acid--peptidoglycan teichoic acid transferase